MQHLAFRRGREDSFPADPWGHSHDAAPQSFDDAVPLRSAILADEEGSVCSLLAQPCVRAAVGDAEVNSPAAIFGNTRAEGARAGRRNFFPMFGAIRAAIDTFTANSDDQSFCLCAGESGARPGHPTLKPPEPSADPRHR